MAFADEMRQATEALRRFREETARSAREQQEQRESRGLGGALGAAAGASLRGGEIGRGLSAFGATGETGGAALENAAFDVGIRALRRTNVMGIPVGEIAYLASGVDSAVRARNGAATDTFQLLDDFARHNVPVSDEFLQRVIDVNLAQNTRLQKLHGRIANRTSIADAVPADSPLGKLQGLLDSQGQDLGQKLFDVLDRLRQVIENAPSLPFGGRQQ